MLVNEISRKISMLQLFRKKQMEDNTPEFHKKNDERIDNLEMDLQQLSDKLPSGSGISNVDISPNSKPDKIIITATFTPMNENGYWMRAIDFKVIVTPSFRYNDGMEMRLTAKGRLDGSYRDYLDETFTYALMEDINAKPTLQ